MQLGSVWLAHTDIGVLEFMMTLVEVALSEPVALVLTHSSSKGMIQPVGLHFLVVSCLE